MRAAEAAKNTANLIEGTVKKVRDGSSLVSSTNEAFHQVTESSARVSELVAGISTASNDQAEGIGQINTAVTELDKLTQQNAANAEESASAAEEMSAQAETMQGMMGELVAMVGGAGTATGGAKAGHKAAARGSMPRRPRSQEGEGQGRRAQETRQAGGGDHTARRERILGFLTRPFQEPRRLQPQGAGPHEMFG